jgi:hypothetical protein
MFPIFTRELDCVLRYRLLNPIALVLSKDERYSVGSSTPTIEPLIAPPFPPLEISPSQGLFFIRQCSSASKRAYSTKTHAFLQYFIPYIKLGEIIPEPHKGGGAFFHPSFLSDGVFTGYGLRKQKILIDNSRKNAMILIERFRRNLSMIRIFPLSVT